jgi:beta-lactamase class C
MFRIGSLSKGLTGILCAILVEKGILKWTDKVIDYLPDFKLKNQEQAKRITIAHLLSHSMGLPRHTFTNLLEDGQTITEARSKLGEVDLLAEEGKLFSYQNLAYAIIEEIILKKTGSTYNELLKKYILDPAGMKHASFTYEDLMACNNKSCPHDHMRDGGYAAVPWNQKYYQSSSVGGINASISDMGQWLKVLLGHRNEIVSDSSLLQAFTPFIKIQDKDYYDLWDGVTSSSYGMGWRLLDKGNKTIVYHAGFVNDFRSEIGIDRENNIGICVLFNAQNNYARHVVPTFLNYYDMYKACLSAR